MLAYVDHPRSARRTEIRIGLDGGPVRSEWVWAAPLGGDLYRVDNVPLFAPDVGLHDVVIALAVPCDDCAQSGVDDDEVADTLELIEVTERVTHVRFVFKLAPACDAEAFHSRTRALHAATECFGPRAFVSNLRARTHAAEMQELLEREAEWFEMSDISGASAAGWEP